MLNNAGERSEPRKFCIFNLQMWGKGEIRTLFLFFLPILGGGGERPFRSPSESATESCLHILLISSLTVCNYLHRLSTAVTHFLAITGKGVGLDYFPLQSLPSYTRHLKPHSYGENLLTCANLHMSKFAHVSKS